MALNIKAAFKVLFDGLPEPSEATPVEVTVEVPVPGPAARAELYKFGVEKKWDKYGGGNYYGRYEYAHTCEQAHKLANGEPVEKIKCVRVGKTYFLVSETVKPHQKPKIEKGA